MKLDQHLEMNEILRDDNWELQFLNHFPKSNISVQSPQPQEGPDGWPYIFVGIEKGSKEPSINLIQWLCTRGIGLVVNPQKEMPDYIFTYGMIWNFKERGEFITNSRTVNNPGQVKWDEGQKVLAGAPSEEYLPPYVREVLKQFFKDQGIDDLRILVMSEDSQNFDLCFSLESLGNPQQAEHKGIAEAISWFLPNHYSIVLVSENGLPKFISF